MDGHLARPILTKAPLVWHFSARHRTMMPREPDGGLFPAFFADRNVFSFGETVVGHLPDNIRLHHGEPLAFGNAFAAAIGLWALIIALAYATHLLVAG